ncbi:MAG: NAD(+) synthase, partial [Bacteroidales bacterium]|nr:NAD(+) synthase [Bacteroidales bacterium]
LLGLAEEDGVSLLVFPELCVTGYTCGDLFGQQLLLDGAEKAVAGICEITRGKPLAVVLGVPVRQGGRLYNCAVVVRDGKVCGIVPKLHIPNYNEFYESRWFASGEGLEDTQVTFCGQQVPFTPWQLFHLGHATFAIEICEDLWTPVPPSSYHAMAGAQVLVNLSASNEVLMKHRYRQDLVRGQSARTVSGYVYCSCGYGESTQDLVFAGSSLIGENGALLAENERFRTEGSLLEADLDIEKLNVLRQKENTFIGHVPQTYIHTQAGEAAPTDFAASLLRPVDPHPFVPEGPEADDRAREITSIQVMGLMTRLEHIRCRTAVIGISGGLDSTLALLVTCLAFDRLGWERSRIIGVTMPGFGTTGRTYRNAIDLMAALGVTAREISIVPAVRQHFADIGQDPDQHDVTYENSQARERTQLLMDIANKENGLVVGTGDLSELALGWATYNGDHMSMYGVNASIPKTLVKHLVKWSAVNYFDTEGNGRSAKDILLDVADTPISPELTPADADGNILQKTEDLVGPYELHDFFLYYFFRFGYSPAKIRFLAGKAFLGREPSIGPEGVANVYTPEILDKWLHKFYWRFFSQQFKRSCLPDGPKVGSVSLSPRGDWRMPSDATVTLWIDNLS